MATMSTATQQPSASEAPAAAASGGAAATQHNGSARSSGCPPHVLEAIYGKKTKEEKQAALDHSLQRWWMGACCSCPCGLPFAALPCSAADLLRLITAECRHCRRRVC